MAILDWTGRTARPSHCPVCASDREKQVMLSIPRYADHTGQDWPDLDLVCCPACEVRYYDPPVIIEHKTGDLLKFYIEQGAGIDVMLELLALVDERPVRNYLEIGCGFGFSLDYARESWVGMWPDTTRARSPPPAGSCSISDPQRLFRCRSSSPPGRWRFCARR